MNRKCKYLSLSVVALMTIAGCATTEQEPASDGPSTKLRPFDEFREDATIMALEPDDAKKFTGMTPLRERVRIGEVTYGFTPPASWIVTPKYWEKRLNSYREALRRSLGMVNLLAPDAGAAYVLHASMGEAKEDRPTFGRNTAYFPVQYRVVRISDGKEVLSALITGQVAYHEGLMRGDDIGQRRYAVRHNIWQLVERLYKLEKLD